MILSNPISVIIFSWRCREALYVVSVVYSELKRYIISVNRKLLHDFLDFQCNSTIFHDFSHFSVKIMQWCTLAASLVHHGMDQFFFLSLHSLFSGSVPTMLSLWYCVCYRLKLFHIQPKWWRNRHKHRTSIDMHKKLLS